MENVVSSTPGHQARKAVSARIESWFLRFDSYLSVRWLEITWFIAYLLGNILIFIAGAVPEIEANHEGLKHSLLPVARGFGYTLNLNCGLVLLPGCLFIASKLQFSRIGSWFPFDKVKFIHRIIGTAVVIGTLGHGILQVVLFATKSHPWTTGINGTISVFATGLLLVIFLVGLAVFAINAIRSRLWSYEWFWYTHISSMVLFVIALILHGQHRGKFVTWIYLCPSLVLYVIDLGLRVCFRQGASVSCHEAHVRVYSCGNVLRLDVPIDVDFKAGQHFKIRVPEVSNLEWHPFSPVSRPKDGSLSFVIKRTGDWTGALFALVRKKKAMSGGTVSRNGDGIDVEAGNSGEELNSLEQIGRTFSIHVLRVDVQGPFIGVSKLSYFYTNVALIGGGVALTSMVSILQHLLETGENDFEERLSIDGALSEAEHLAESPRHAKAFVAGSDSQDQDTISDAGASTFANGVYESFESEVSVHSSLLAKLYRRFLTIYGGLTALLLVLWVLLIRLTLLIACLVANVASMNTESLEPFDWIAVTYIDVVLNGLTLFFLQVPLLAMNGIRFGWISQEFLFGLIMNSASVLNFAFGVAALAADPAWPYGSYQLLVLLCMETICVVGLLNGLLYLEKRPAQELPDDSPKSISGTSLASWVNRLDLIWVVRNEIDDEWILDLLSAIPYDKRLHLWRYVTSGNVTQEMEMVPHTWKGSFTLAMGRPHWETLLESIGQSLPVGESVGVFVCGSPQLEQDVKNGCDQWRLKSRKTFLNHRKNNFSDSIRSVSSLERSGFGLSHQAPVARGASLSTRSLDTANSMNLDIRCHFVT